MLKKLYFLVKYICLNSEANWIELNLITILRQFN